MKKLCVGGGKVEGWEGLKTKIKCGKIMIDEVGKGIQVFIVLF